MKNAVKRIGVLTSGGDAPGMNACIRAVVRSANARGIECVGIRRGYQGLISGDIVEMDNASVSRIINRGGTILYTARSDEFRTPEGQKKAANTCKLLGLDGIVAIGGVAFAAYSYIIARNSPSYASMATLIDVAMVGICVGFILHNWHPAKLFMGDSGSMLLGYLITCASIVMTGRLDPASIHASVYLPVFMPILLPILVLFLPVLDMCLAIVRRLSHGQSPMHPDRMHLHHRMLRIGHTVQGAVLILWGWAALIAVGSIMTLFFKVHYVLIGFVIAVVLLTVATMYPYLKRRLPEIAAENQSYASARRRARHSFDESGDGKKRRP